MLNACLYYTFAWIMGSYGFIILSCNSIVTFFNHLYYFNRVPDTRASRLTHTFNWSSGSTKPVSSPSGLLWLEHKKSTLCRKMAGRETRLVNSAAKKEAISPQICQQCAIHPVVVCCHDCQPQPFSVLTVMSWRIHLPAFASNNLHCGQWSLPMWWVLIWVLIIKCEILWHVNSDN